VILMSAFDFEDSGITSLKITPFLRKPVKISDFIAKVREQLDGIKENIVRLKHDYCYLVQFLNLRECDL
jgi:hypothetical protein